MCLLFCTIGKFDFRRTLDKNEPAQRRAWQTDDRLKEVNVKAFFKFILIKIVIFGKKIVHMHYLKIGAPYNKDFCSQYKKVSSRLTFEAVNKCLRMFELVRD